MIPQSTPYESLRLENQLCFPLYACSREIIRQYKSLLDPLGLTYTQYLTMMVLWEHGCVTAKALGGMLHLDSGTLTPLLKRLESKGYLTRRRDPEDERSLLVSPTETGMALRDQAVKIPVRIAETTPLSIEDGQALYRILYEILAQAR